MKPMRVYDAVLASLALVAGALMAALFVIIIYDVALRSAGMRSPTWTLSVAEYGLLYLTTLAAPWLMRHGGHVSVNTFVDQMPPNLRNGLLRVVHMLGGLVCLIVAILSFRVATTIGGFDIRSIAVPRWVVLATMPLGFLLLAIEFARIAITADFDRGRAEH